MESEPRFLADAMLGSLARWLRVLGFDTFYDPGLEDAELVARAVADERIILTRDRRLVERRDAHRHLLLRSERLEGQLREVVAGCGLRLRDDRLFGRCLRCNGRLLPIPVAAVRGRVPAHVAATRERFRECVRCRRVYWRASHVRRMLERLDAFGLRPAGAAPGEAR